MTLTQMKNIMEAEGVSEIDASGEYNPYEHQAMMTESHDEIENDHIIQVLQKGYKLNGKHHLTLNHSRQNASPAIKSLRDASRKGKGVTLCLLPDSGSPL